MRQECFGSYESPINSPLEEKLPSELKRSSNVSIRVDWEERKGEGELCQISLPGISAETWAVSVTCTWAIRNAAFNARLSGKESIRIEKIAGAAKSTLILVPTAHEYVTLPTVQIRR